MPDTVQLDPSVLLPEMSDADDACVDRLAARVNALPADGVTTAGESRVGQAPVTAESIPVERRPVDDLEAALADPERVDATHRVFAGTINGAVALEIAVTRRAQDSTLTEGRPNALRLLAYRDGPLNSG